MFRRVFLAVFAAVSAPALADARDVGVYVDTLTCEADWRCVEGGPVRGHVSSTAQHELGEVEQCRLDLLAQVRETGICIGDYTLDDATFTTAEHHEERLMLTCGNGEGARTCQLLADLHDSFNWNCTGDACYQVWRNQGTAIDALIENWNRITLSPWLISRDIAQRAEREARFMCNTTITAEPEWVVWLVNKINAAGTALYRLQQRGELAVPYRCQMDIN